MIKSLRFPTLGQLTSEFITTFKRFPLAVLSALVSMILIIYLIEKEGPEYAHFETLIKIAFVASLGIFMFTALRLFGDKNPLCLAGIVAIVGYYLVLPDMKNPSSMVFQRHLYLNLAFFIMILWASYWKASPENESHWEWTQQVVFGFLTSIVFGIILYAGLSGALYAVNELFSLEISAKRYGQLVFLVIGLFGVNYFLSQIPKNTTSLEIHAYTKVENIFTKYILTPLAVGYFLILYTYSFKILITHEWPKGILAWIIIAFSAVAIVTYLFWTQLWSQRAKRYKHFLFVALFLQTIMLGVALSIRVSDYAWTENRYMVAMLGAWLFGISLYFLFIKSAKFKWLFLTLSLLIMISQIGPFSSYEVAKSSQQKRLHAMLENAKPLSEKSAIKTRYEISSMIEYLTSNHGVESLNPVMPEIVSKFNAQDKSKRPYGFSSFATQELGFDFINRWEMRAQQEGNTPFSIFLPKTNSLDISGYDWIVQTTYSHDSRFKGRENPEIENRIIKIDTIFRLDEKRLKIVENNVTIANIPLESFFQSLMKHKSLKIFQRRYAPENDAYEKVTFKHRDKNVSVKLMINNMNADLNGTLNFIHAEVLYKRFK